MGFWRSTKAGFGRVLVVRGVGSSGFTARSFRKFLGPPLKARRSVTVQSRPGGRAVMPKPGQEGG